MTEGTVEFRKQHDTANPLTITCTDNGGVVDLTPATLIRIIASSASTGTQVFAATVTGSNIGVVTRPWQTLDVATPGTINLEVEVTWPGGTVQTFPSNGYLRVIIERDLG